MKRQDALLHKTIALGIGLVLTAGITVGMWGMADSRIAEMDQTRESGDAAIGTGAGTRHFLPEQIRIPS